MPPRRDHSAEEVPGIGMEFRKVPPILGVLEVELEASRGGVMS